MPERSLRYHEVLFAIGHAAVVLTFCEAFQHVADVSHDVVVALVGQFRDLAARHREAVTGGQASHQRGRFGYGGRNRLDVFVGIHGQKTVLDRPQTDRGRRAGRGPETVQGSDLSTATSG